jgi:poly(3-hydroxyalkanoate) synthetase
VTDKGKEENISTGHVGGLSAHPNSIFRKYVTDAESAKRFRKWWKQMEDDQREMERWHDENFT